MSKLLQQAVTDEERLKHDREVTRLRSQLTILQDKYGQAVRELSAVERQLEVVQSIESRGTRELKVPKQGRAHGSTAILVLTDWHVEETVNPAMVNGLNEYNLKIAAARVECVIQRFLELLEGWRKTWPVKELVVGLLGDMIAGYIHEELVESNSLSPTEAVLFASELIEAALRRLKKESGCKTITVVTSNGNHGRTTPKPRVSTAYKNSYEWLMYKTLERAWAGDPVVKWKVECGYHNLLEIEGHLTRFHHGDAFQFGGGVGGIAIPVSKKIAQWNKSRRAVLDLFGHWHQFVDMWNWVCCSALIGYGPYSMKIGAEFQPPTQTMVLMSRSKGKVAALPIFCDANTAKAVA